MMMMMLRPSLETGLSWIAVAALAILVGTDARPAPAAEPEIHSALLRTSNILASR